MVNFYRLYQRQTLWLHVYNCSLLGIIKFIDRQSLICLWYSSTLIYSIGSDTVWRHIYCPYCRVSCLCSSLSPLSFTRSHTELNPAAHFTVQMLQITSVIVPSASDDSLCLRVFLVCVCVCVNIDVCARETNEWKRMHVCKKWLTNACVLEIESDRWELIRSALNVKSCRWPVMTCSADLISLDISDFSPRHVRWIFSSDRFPRGSARSWSKTTR